MKMNALGMNYGFLGMKKSALCERGVQRADFMACLCHALQHNGKAKLVAVYATNAY
jgi:hypothetical protein